jgi:hypothetical protein
MALSAVAFFAQGRWTGVFVVHSSANNATPTTAIGDLLFADFADFVFHVNFPSH